MRWTSRALQSASHGGIPEEEEKECCSVGTVAKEVLPRPADWPRRASFESLNPGKFQILAIMSLDYSPALEPNATQTKLFSTNIIGQGYEGQLLTRGTI